MLPHILILCQVDRSFAKTIIPLIHRCHSAIPYLMKTGVSNRIHSNTDNQSLTAYVIFKSVMVILNEVWLRCDWQVLLEWILHAFFTIKRQYDSQSYSSCNKAVFKSWNKSNFKPCKDYLFTLNTESQTEKEF